MQKDRARNMRRKNLPGFLAFLFALLLNSVSVSCGSMRLCLAYEGRAMLDLIIAAAADQGIDNRFSSTCR